MPPKLHRDPLRLGAHHIVALADIVQREELHHQMVHRVHWRAGDRDAVVASIDMQEIGGIGVRM